MKNVSFTTEKIINENPNLINPFENIRTDICPYCKAQRIELISFNGYSQNYSEAVNMFLRGYKILYDKYEIRSMACKSCGKEFVIDWGGDIPRPLLDRFRLNMFYQDFLLGI